MITYGHVATRYRLLCYALVGQKRGHWHNCSLNLQQFQIRTHIQTIVSLDKSEEVRGDGNGILCPWKAQTETLEESPCKHHGKVLSIPCNSTFHIAVWGWNIAYNYWRSMTRKLYSMQWWHLRSIMGAKWQDGVRNFDILERTCNATTEQLLANRLYSSHNSSMVIGEQMPPEVAI